jgi:hypothetical protein
LANRPSFRETAHETREAPKVRARRGKSVTAGLRVDDAS